MEIKIERNNIMPGFGCMPGFNCLFEHKGQEYLASLIIQTAYADFHGTECLIFKIVDKQITFENALGVCGMRNCEFTPGTLKDIVEDFIKYN